MASVEKRVDRNGKVSYRAQVRLKGHPRITATFKSKRDALNWGHKTEVEMQYQHFKPAPPKSYLVADLIDRYLETTILQKFRDTNRDAAKLMWWKKEIGHLLLSNLTPAVIAEKRVFCLTRISHQTLGKLGTPVPPNIPSNSFGNVYEHSLQELLEISKNSLFNLPAELVRNTG